MQDETLTLKTTHHYPYIIGNKHFDVLQIEKSI